MTDFAKELRDAVNFSVNFSPRFQEAFNRWMEHVEGRLGDSSSDEAEALKKEVALVSEDSSLPVEAMAEDLDAPGE